MNKPAIIAFILNAVFLLFSTSSVAQEVYIPPDLEPWREWVLYDKEHLSCPFFNARQYGNISNHRCAWPGALNLSLIQKGGTFSQVWRVYQDSWILLPGNNEHWPLDVKVNGSTIDVASLNKAPSIFLEPGTHRISGRFEWVTRPGLLPVPAMTALLNLTLDGNEISIPDWRGDGVWLGDRDRVVEEQERIDVVVYRAISDGVPITVDTRIEIEVSGPSREVVLGVALLDDFIPISIRSPLPARLESDGRLRVQVRPGSWGMVVSARASEPGDTIIMQTASAPWPDEEIWSYRADNRLRVTAPEGSSPVDPDQTGVPSGWNRLPAFRMKPGEALTIVERQRGLTDQDANRLSLNRLLWMDFDGAGLSAVDVLSGSMRRDWRLDMQLPFILSNATNRDQSKFYLVTSGSEEGSTGIEIRTPNVSLVTHSRVEHGSRIPVTGWSENFESVKATLFTPPGVRLIAAPGSDRAIGAWASQWRLLDFFLVLVIAVAAGRLVNPVFGVITLIMLVFTYHEPYAPAWSWLNMLIAIALASVAPEGRLRKFTRRYLVASIAIMVIIAVPFVANQARLAMFPQLENVNLTTTRYSTPFDHNFGEDGYADYRIGATFGPAMAAQFAARAPAANFAMKAGTDGQIADQSDIAEQGLITVTGSRIQRVDIEGPSPVSVIDRDEVEASSDTSVDQILQENNRSRERLARPQSGVQPDSAEEEKQTKMLSRYAPNTRLQTGPGYPQWSWSAYTLQWSGPVDPAQSMRLIVSPAWLTAIWRVLGALLLIWVLARLVRSHISLPKISGTTGNVAAAILLACFLGPLGTQDAHAEIPDAKTLAELQKRLTKGPDCLRVCTDIVEASVRVSTDSVTIAMEVHANADIAATLPGRKGRWMPNRVFVDGREVRNIYSFAGVSWIELTKGVHQVRVEGPLAATDKNAIHFAGSVRYVRVDADGWDVSGIVDNRLLEDTLVLSRVKSEDGGRQKTLASDQFPNFALVTRKFALDLDWTVITTVYRRAPDNGTMTFAIPLLDGESVTSSDIEVRDNSVIASFSADQRNVSWRTTIPRSDALRLEAPLDKPWTEIWWLSVGQSWNVEYSGVPEIRARVSDRSAWVAEFDPLPGEALDIAISRPVSVPGETLAIDRVVLTDKIGKRSTDSKLSFYYRSTLGGQQDIRLPADADVTSVSAKGSTLPLRPRDGVLPVPVEPGYGVVTVNWRTTNGAAMINRSSVVDLGIGSTNLDLRMSTPGDRWLLLTSGPHVGPAILYWPELIVLIAFSIVLGRFGKTPLRTVDWVLLGLGLSTFSWTMLLIFAVWVFVMKWRGGAAHLSAAPRFNLTQTLIGLISVAVLLGLLVAVPEGLLGSPNMQVANAGRSAGLYWFQDMSSPVLPTASVISAPLWVYKVAILLWSLWLSFSLIKWLPWAWRCFSYNGLWKGKVATDS